MESESGAVHSETANENRSLYPRYKRMHKPSKRKPSDPSYFASDALRTPIPTPFPGCVYDSSSVSSENQTLDHVHENSRKTVDNCPILL